MNMDTGIIRMWSDLTNEEKESGRWVMLTEGEYEQAITIEEHKRRESLSEIFAKTENQMQGLMSKLKAFEAERGGGIDRTPASVIERKK